MKIKYEAPVSDTETVYENEKPQSKRSPAWQHFTTLGLEKTAECIYCQKLVPTFNNTSGLLKHLQRHHKEVWSEMSLKKQAENAVKSEATVPFMSSYSYNDNIFTEHWTLGSLVPHSTSHQNSSMVPKPSPNLTHPCPTCNNFTQAPPTPNLTHPHQPHLIPPSFPSLKFSPTASNITQPHSTPPNTTLLTLNQSHLT